MIFDLIVIWLLLLLAPLSHNKKEAFFVVFCLFLYFFIGFYFLHLIEMHKIKAEYYFLAMSSIDFVAVVGLGALKSRKAIKAIFFISMLYNQLAYLEYLPETAGFFTPFYNYYSEVMTALMLSILYYGTIHGKFAELARKSWDMVKPFVHRYFRLLQHKDTRRLP